MWDWVDYEGQSIGGVAQAPDGPLEVQTYNGLNQPHTYSDMTGAALVGTACGPVG